MGSKNLKAIVASGNNRPEIHDPEKYKQIIKQIASTYQKSEPLKLFGATGTTRHVNGLNMRAIYPTLELSEFVFRSIPSSKR